MYHIKKIENWDMSKLHIGIADYETAYDILVCISAANKRNRRKVVLKKWALEIDNGKIIYQIGLPNE